MQIFSGKMLDISGEFDIYKIHNANHKLAIALAAIFQVTSYTPLYKTIDERIQHARSAVDFEKLSLDLPLRERIEYARVQMGKARTIEQNNGREIEVYRISYSFQKKEKYAAVDLVKIILENFDEILKILKAAIQDIDSLRGKYGYAPLKDYINTIPVS